MAKLDNKSGEKLGNNPKDRLGIKKVSLSKLPMAGIAHGAHAMMYGAAKYGPFNWRGNAVVASIYVDAILRHVAAWFDGGEEVASDSGVHHLGHIVANASILLDAMETGNLLDDRPTDGRAAQVLERLNAVVKKAGEAKDELAGSNPNAPGSGHPVVDAQIGLAKPHVYTEVSNGKGQLVCAPGAPEDDATGYR